MDNSYLFICFLIIPCLFLLFVPKTIIKNNTNINRKVFITYLIISLIIVIKSIMMIPLKISNKINLTKKMTLYFGNPICCPSVMLNTKILTKKPIEASARECEENSRSHSAKLRIIEKI
jgi:hypothetical protein